MLKFFDLLLTPINKLLGSPGLLSFLKSSPLVIIPILLYVWGGRYLDSQSRLEEQKLLLSKVQLALDTNPKLTAPVSYYLLRASPSEDYFTIYLGVVDCMNVNDTIYSGKVIEESYRFVDHLRGFFDTEAKFQFAMNYFKNLQNLDAALLSYLLVESDKYDKEIGQDRVVKLLTNTDFMTEERRNKLSGLLHVYVDSHKLKRSERNKILPKD
ncbi:MAG: hypothetical protein ABJG78_04345 [Cyclobacteriaceae bacterium]